MSRNRIVCQNDMGHKSSDHLCLVLNRVIKHKPILNRMLCSKTEDSLIFMMEGQLYWYIQPMVFPSEDIPFFLFFYKGPIENMLFVICFHRLHHPFYPT